MRHWLSARCILIALLLVAAPGAALAHVLLTWVPRQVALARLDREVTRERQRLDVNLEQGIRLQQQSARLQELLTATAAQPDWLPQRDQHGVFDRLAEAFHDERITLEQLTLGEPVVCAAVSRTNLLACEQVTAFCSGDYAALTACIDRVCELELPVLVKKLAWRRTDTHLTLAMQLQIPFVPDQALRELLADKAELPEENHEP